MEIDPASMRGQKIKSAGSSYLLSLDTLIAPDDLDDVP